MNIKSIFKLFSIYIILLHKSLFAQDGSVVANFNPKISPVVGNHISSVISSNDGNLIISGKFATINNITKNNIAKIDTDGNLISTFQGLVNIDESIWTSAEQNDNKIIVGGGFKTINGTVKKFIARLNSDGSLDNTFNPIIDTNSIFNTIYDIKIQNDGKILIAGWFSSINGVSISKIARLNVDGTLDTSFNPPNFGSNGSIGTLKIQNDGKILIGGRVLNYNNQSNVFRLNIDGTLDTSFNIGAGANNKVHSININSDEDLIISGEFTSFNNQSVNKIVKLSPNGDIVTSFNNNISFNPISTVIQSNDKIIVAGYQKIIRLNKNGSVDTYFDNGNGPNLYVNKLFINNNFIFVGGDYSTINNFNIPKLSKLNLSENLSLNDFSNDETITLFPNPTFDYIKINSKTNYTGYRIWTINGILISNSQKLNSQNIDLRKLKPGIYVLELWNNKSSVIRKVIKK